MPSTSHSELPAVFKNSMPILAWGFMAVWMGMLVYFTKLVIAVPGVHWLAIAFIALFWIFGLGFTALVLWLPLVRVEVSAEGVVVREKALLWRRVRQFAASDLAVSAVVEQEDSEGGGVHYTCSLILPDKQNIILAQGMSRPKVTQARLQLLGALMTAQRRSPKNPFAH